MSKSLEEIVIVGFIAILALKFLSTGAQTSAAVAYQNSTLGQTAGYAAIGEGIVNTFSNDFS
jgi:hypothetical protein